jgi:hypothetical protein
MEGLDKDTNQPSGQLIFVEDIEVHMGDNSITVTRKNINIRNDFKWNT